MKKSILIFMALTLTFQSAHALNCSVSLNQVAQKVKRAEIQLQNRTENLKMYSELAGEALESSRMSIILMATSAAMLTGGVVVGGLSGVGGGTTLAPGLNAVIGSIIGQSKTAALGVVLTPTVLAIGTLGVGLAAEIDLAIRIKKSQNLAEQLIGADQNFDDAQKVLDQRRQNVNLDYSQLTDFLGLRDRKMTRELLEIATHAKEVDELRLAHMQVSQRAIIQACQSSDLK